MTKYKVELTVNEVKRKLEVGPQELLIDVLRENLGLIGTKKGCGGGECGACTVLLDGNPVSSCLIIALQVDGSKITTIEGIQDSEAFRVLDECFVSNGSFQCGFCAPGMVLSSTALLIKNPSPTMEEIKVAIAGNTCRCSGYTKIIEAIQQASQILMQKMEKES